MNTKFTSLVRTMALSLSLLVGLSFAQGPMPGFPSVSGTVTFNGTPVPNFILFITPSDTSGTHGFMPYISTDENGKYSHDLFPGNWTIASHDTFSYMPFSQTIKAEGTNQDTVDIALTARPQDAAFAGLVHDTTGAGVQDTVYLLKLSDSTDMKDFADVESHFMIPMNMRTLQWASYAFPTDAKGNFSGQVLFGKYAIYAPGNADLLPSWSAMEITGDVTGYDITLKPIVTVSGTVSNASGFMWAKVAGFSVNSGRPFSTEVNMMDGTYALDVAPGEYVFRVSAYFMDNDKPYTYVGYYDGKATPKDADHVNVQNNMSGIDFTLPDAQVSHFTVMGTVTSNNSKKPVANAQVSIVSTNVMQNTMQTYDATTDANGAYSITGSTILAEDSLIAFVHADGFFAEFYDNQTTFLTADKVLFHPNETITLDFGLDSLDTSNGYSISGNVTDTDGKAIPFGQVTAYTTATNVGVATTQVDSNGAYSFDAIFPSGSTVFLQCWAGFDYKPEIYDNVDSWQNATAIQIDNANVDNINFSLEPMPSNRLALGDIVGQVNLPSNSGIQAANATADPYAGATVYIRPAGQQEWNRVDFVDDQGNFDLPIDTYGDYDIILTAPGYQDQVTTVSVTKETGLSDNSVEMTLTPTVIDGGNNARVIRSDKLYAAYPNPFNPTTTIRVDLMQTENVQLLIFNVVGQKVATLYSGTLPSGTKSFKWNGKDFSGRSVSSGLYFYQLRTNSTVQTKSLIFLK